MVKNNKYSFGYKLFTILIGALLMGFLWRVRGTHGWGSSWGLLNAGFVFTMFITMVMDERKKMDFGWLALSSVIFMLTVPAWGTLLDQITGVLFEAEELQSLVLFDSVYSSDVYCSVPSAIYIMLTLGFGLASLYGIMLGRAYSDKQWKLKHYIILLAVFFAADIIAKATVSHWVLNLVQPQAGDVFEGGLKDYMLTFVPEGHLESVKAALEVQDLEGITLRSLKTLIYEALPADAAETFFNAATKGAVEDSAWEVYLKHFDDVSWAKKIIGGRNYFQSIEMISLAIKAVAALITTRFIIKDKRAANTGFVVCGAFAFAITAADLFFYFGDGGYHKLAENYFGDNVAPWSCWEYFTGFIAGGIITAHMLRLKPQEDVEDLAFNKVPEKLSKILTFALGYLFLIGVSIVRPVLERFDESKNQIIYVVISVLVTVGIVAILAKKWGFAAEKTNMVNISSTLLPLFMGLIFISYMFLCSYSYQNYTSITMVHNIMVVISLIAVDIWIIIQSQKLKA